MEKFHSQLTQQPNVVLMMIRTWFVVLLGAWMGVVALHWTHKWWLVAWQGALGHGCCVEWGDWSWVNGAPLNKVNPSPIASSVPGLMNLWLPFISFSLYNASKSSSNFKFKFFTHWSQIFITDDYDKHMEAETEWLPCCRGLFQMYFLTVCRMNSSWWEMDIQGLYLTVNIKFAPVRNEMIFDSLWIIIFGHLWPTDF